MVDIPVKQYRMRRARKWLMRRLVPFSLRAGAVAGKWSKADLDRFPPRSQSDVPGLGRYEYTWLSQNGEDGILRYLFDEIGFESRWLVEFGFGAKQCNALRLLVKEGFNGLLMDGSQENVDFFNFAANKHGIDDRVRAVQAFITRGNLEELITSNGVPRDIDFLSLDVDGNDYWFWETLECVSPRVVCIEYNAGLGPDLSLTVPYDDAFERFSRHPSGFFLGASLAALASLGKRKGYYLIGCDSTGTNAFFLRKDISIEGVAELTPREAFRPHANWLGRGFSEAEQLEFMAAMPYEEV
jgi:hypothetical protein